jgi:hypothetical protein
VAVAVDERMTAGLAVDVTQLEGAFRGALRLSSEVGEVQWIRWVLGTLQRLGRPPSVEIARQLAAVAPIVLDAVADQVEELVGANAARAASLDAEGLTALATLTGLRDRLRVQRAGPTPNVGSS